MSADTRSKPQTDSAHADEQSHSQETGTNRRAFPRLSPTDVGGLAGVRLASGAEIKLIDLSRGGAQFESDRRFLPNSTVSLRLVTRDSTFVVNGRVVRSRIVRLASGGLGYNVAVAFNELLQHVLDDAAVQAAAQPTPPPAAAPDPVVPEARQAEDTLQVQGTAIDTERATDITAEEGAAFEAAAPHAPTMLTVTAAVDSSGEELLDMFNGNDW